MIRPARHNDAAQMWLVAVLAVTAALIWLAFGRAGGHYSWAAQSAFLFDFAAIAAFVWSLPVTWRIWRRRDA